jgi:predicted nuclease of predicted toxin-antitoxin system
MRILLDESLPRQLASELSGHKTQTVQRRGWSGLENGVLLRTASSEFDVLLTGDKNLEFQQNPASLSIAVIVLLAVNNRVAAPVDPGRPGSAENHPPRSARSCGRPSLS